MPTDKNTVWGDNWLKKNGAFYKLGFAAIEISVVGLVTYFAFNFSVYDLFLVQGSNDDLARYLDSFRQKHSPITEINFTSLYGGGGQFQILHPLLDIRKLRVQNPNPICNDKNGQPEKSQKQMAQTAFVREENYFIENDISGKRQTKSEVFEHFLNEGEKLPTGFLESAPFTDKFGYSYAYLLSQTVAAPFNQKLWVEQHLSFFKVSELSEVLNAHQIHDTQYSTISRLNESQVEEIVRGENLVFTKEFIFFKNQSRLGFSPLSYWVYSAQEFRAELANEKYDLIAYTPGALCLQRFGSSCWTYSSNHALSYLYRYSMMILLLLGLAFLTFFGFYFKRQYDKNLQQHKNRLALQVLSHEFRTPVSSMLLLLEQLSKNQSKFEDAQQDLITALSTEVFRLQRIIEVSRTYLQTESHRVNFKYVELPSINQWIEDFAAEINPDVRCELLNRDQAIKADPFWLRFILSNIVQNAFMHGKAPVIIRLENGKGELKIVVEDQGACEFQSLNQMTDAFAKSSSSKGMGLGLNIAKFILDDWGSEMHFSNSPTKFTLLLNEPRLG